ncbi:hypothetical protein CEXT_102671 [Caerostris extrusa]|uniref:Uncharacterized protein n=1 Tax=Caerostris extrusa TaxID=172846 RepID=A0AAV4M8Z8_CAEEX|nr:hypothetical protein CEXT_102671 [Caerostris extrusa]
MDKNDQKDESCLQQNENKEKIQTDNIGGDLLNNDCPPLENSVDIGKIVPDHATQDHIDCSTNSSGLRLLAP